ncbi:jasmonate-induced protein homolog isoform X1 [Malania oleifera]|uniref:jasmonate-induced protein homolog isoform X1 n=1 Tax=Malania oleifera TaxID=397392 RepID=UPI0025ADDED1|nr:jasmonate-induced protein homolog isoform X1 [Malania oleifera]
MAAEYSKVLGKAITDSTLRAMPAYAGKTITQKDRATVAALLLKGASQDQNSSVVQQYTEQLKKELAAAGLGAGPSTVCVIHNLTGDTVTFATSHVWDKPAVPPVLKDIENGQTLVFMNKETHGTAVVYRGKNSAREECDWMLSWSNLNWDGKSVSKVYTEINAAHHYDTANVWDAISKQLDVSGPNRTAAWNGCVSNVTIDSGAPTPTFNAYLTLGEKA